MPSSPIGIFDSGLGGLTVLKEIDQLFPHENLIYLGDTARVPYGTKSAETVQRYSREICDFFIGQGVKAIVVACNTASALALPQLQEFYSVPLLGVLEPGVRAAVQSTRTQKIGVIGTKATIQSQSYPKRLQEKLPEAEIYSQACPLFVPLVEEGWTDHEITRRVSEVYLSNWKEGKVDTVILGCTHYPLLKKVLSEVLGSEISLVDSAQETAQSLLQLLQEKNKLASSREAGSRVFYATDAPEKMREFATLLLGKAPEKVEFVDLSGQ